MNATSSHTTEPHSIICAWCARVMREGPADLPTTHGICASCMKAFGDDEIDDVTELTVEQADALPWGVVRLVGDGVIERYNSVESSISHRRPSEVIGKHFFREVAPCTAVKEFEGRLQALRATKRSGADEIEFQFRFPDRSMRVRIRMVYAAAHDKTLLLVHPLTTE